MKIVCVEEGSEAQGTLIINDRSLLALEPCFVFEIPFAGWKVVANLFLLHV